MNVFSRERLNFESDLRRALPQKQFELHYQPKMDVATDRVNSVEALLRWRNPSRGVIGPLEFMPIAQEAGLMSSISEWVLNEACRQAREWQVAGLPFVRIAVNISPIQFRQSRFLESVRTALSEHHLEPRFLEIELTETAIMDQAESSVTILEELSRMGVLVSIDDFGAGYSSMSYLRRLPIDKLKIDQSLIQDLTTHSDATSIVTAIISLAHSLRLKVVAEGVETKEQLQELRALGCDQYQGFYRSAAVPPGEIERLLTARSESTDLQDQPRLTDTQRKLAALERS
jgi:EAL domain-containing protein (putative c-di-GMP-specific phosphodiesterase class I)